MGIVAHSRIGLFSRTCKVTMTGNRVKIPVESPATGYSSEPSPDTEHCVEVIIDVDRLINQLAGRAIRSKGGKAIESSGAIVVKRL